MKSSLSNFFLFIALGENQYDLTPLAISSALKRPAKSDSAEGSWYGQTALVRKLTGIHTSRIALGRR